MRKKQSSLIFKEGGRSLAIAQDVVTPTRNLLNMKLNQQLENDDVLCWGCGEGTYPCPFCSMEVPGGLIIEHLKKHVCCECKECKNGRPSMGR